MEHLHMKTRTQQIEELNKEWTNPRWEGITRPYLSLIHISEPTRLGMISYAVFCLKKKKKPRERQKSSPDTPTIERMIICMYSNR